jgi:hypothetical protein
VVVVFAAGVVTVFAEGAVVFEEVFTVVVVVLSALSIFDFTVVFFLSGFAVVCAPAIPASPIIKRQAIRIFFMFINFKIK